MTNSSPRLAAHSRTGMAMQWAPTVLLALSLCAGVRWLWSVPLRSFFLKADDFVYLARSRTVASLCGYLFTPYGDHVVPLFLLESHLLARLAGSLEAVPTVVGWACYATLVLAMALTGHLVAWETGRPARGLAAMAAVGFTSVLGPVLLWFAAGQALAAGTMILAMLAALQAWRARGSWWQLALAVLAALAAPLLWSAGYTAGPVGAAYLWADGRRACRRAAALPLLVSAVTFLLARGVAPRIFAMPAQRNEELLRVAVDVGPAAAHTVQAVCEVLVFNNLGLDAPTTAPQAFVIGLALAVIWAWTRRPFDRGGARLLRRINPLEAAGAVLTAASFGMIFAVRGTTVTFDSLRVFGWYDAIPELGAVLFVSGWWSGHIESPPPKAIEPPARLELLVVVLFAVTMLMLQTPRVERVIFQYDQLSAPNERDRSIHTAAELAERALAQRQALAVLDRLEQTARERGTGRAEIRHGLKRLMIPGLAGGVSGVDAADLLDITDTAGRSLGPNRRGNFE